MNKPKVLIHVSGGIADYVVLGDVEVEIVDEDNIDAGDPPVQLDPSWEPLMKGIFDLPNSKYVRIAKQA
ncbi:MAG: hypothetical protein M1449_00365 [Candidatus Thermoplasmatota archaeon]|nr:hypothetical protein [Candidatus Thermoplasmatota archaeon]